jgi:hypothetical protein
MRRWALSPAFLKYHLDGTAINGGKENLPIKQKTSNPGNTA